MEAQLFTFAVFTAIASLVLALVVLLKVVRLRPDFLRRVASTSGFRWVLLGLAAAVPFLLLDMPTLLPVLVVAGGLTAIGIELHRNGG